MIFNPSEIDYCQNANDFFTKLFHEIPDLIFQFIIAPDNTYSFPFLSKEVYEVFEFSVVENSADLKRHVYESIHEADQYSFLQSLVFSQKNLVKWQQEFRVLIPNKGLRWFKVSSKPELLADGSVAFYGRISDITTLKNQEIKLTLTS